MSNLYLGLRAPHLSVSVLAQPSSNLKVPRPPLINPYDKFTQPEFDAWIGDMTHALRRALGYEQEEQEQIRSEEQVDGSTYGQIPEYHQLDASEQEEEPEDSFAQIKSRRAKGKARDPREGPGFGKGDRAQPIEIPSSDEEEEQVAQNLTFREDEEFGDSEEEEDEEEDDEDDEDDDDDEEYDEDYDVPWKYGESSSQPLSSLPLKFGPPKLARKKQQAVHEHEEQIEDEEDDDSKDYTEEHDQDSEGEFEERRGSRAVLKRKSSPEIITVDSEDEDEDSEGDKENRQHVFGSSPNHGPPMVNEDYSDGEEVEEVHPSDDDTSFPPHKNSISGQPPELRDSWEARKKFAADLYTGGDVVLLPENHADVNHLGPMDDEFIEEVHEGGKVPQPGQVDNQHLPNAPLTAQETDNGFVDWEGSPINLEVFYPEGGSQQVDLSLFAQNEDEDSGMDSFLTPGVITPNQTEMHSYLDDKGDLGRGLDQGSIESISQSIPAHSLRQQGPPHDTEIIAIDDSDDEAAEKDDPSREDDLEVILPSGYFAGWHTTSADALVNGTEKVRVGSIVEGHNTPFTEHLAASSEENMSWDEVPSVQTTRPDSPGGPIEIAPSGLMVSENVKPPTSMPQVTRVDDRDDLEDIYGSPVPEEIMRHSEREETMENETQILSAEEPVLSEGKVVSHEEDLIMEQTIGVDLRDGDNSFKAPVLSGHFGHLEASERSLTPLWEKNRPAPLSELSDVSSVESGSQKASVELEGQINNHDSDTTVTRNSIDSGLDYNDDEKYLITEVDDNVEVLTVESMSDREDAPLTYTVEEPVSVGRLTEEQSNREGSLDVESIATRRSSTPEGLRNAVSTIGHHDEPEVLVLPDTMQPGMSSSIRISPFKELHLPGQPGIPMPVTADASVPDPTESPTLRGSIGSLPTIPTFVLIPDDASYEPLTVHSGIPNFGPAVDPFEVISLVSHPRISTDGLFTPAEISTTTTPAASTPDMHAEDKKENANAVPPATGQLQHDLVETTNPVEFEDKLPSDTNPFGEIHLEASSLDNSTFIASSTIDVEPTSLPSPTAQAQSISLHVPLSRQSTDPVLMADPYPYSLSTPGASQFPDDEDSLEENVLDNSMSSDSTAEKGMERDEVGIFGNVPFENDLELPQASQTDISTELEIPPTALLGDIEVHLVKENAKVTQPFVAAETTDSPEVPLADAKDMVLTDTVQLTQDDDTPRPEGVLTHGTKIVDQGIQSVKITVDVIDGVVPQQDVAFQASKLGSGSPKKVFAESEPHITKRKRGLSPDSILLEGSPSKTRGKRPKSKGIGKAVERPPVQHHDEPRQPVQSGCDLPEHNLGLAPLPSDSSFTQMLPVVTLGSKSTAMDISTSGIMPVTQPQLQFLPTTLFHAHGRKQQKRQALLQSVKRRTPLHQPELPRKSTTEPVVEHTPSPVEPTHAFDIPEAHHEPVQAAISDVVASTIPTREPSPDGPSQLVFNEPVADTPEPKLTPVNEPLARQSNEPQNLNPLPSPVRAALLSNSSTNTRSMRSRCMYHRISLPKEGGARLYFLVPGCSLSNQELMKQEQIEDHGGATYEDSLRMIRDIESLDLDRYLIGVIRQLVGLDILREGEVFYLPQPGDDVQRKTSPRKSISERSAMGRVPGGDSSSFAGSPVSARSPSTRPPLSNADSTSTTLSAFRRVVDSERGSSELATDSEPEVEEKESRMSSKTQDHMDTNTSPTKPKQTRGRKRKGKAKDTSYQPDEQEQDSLEEGLPRKKTRKSTRLIKRTRTMEAGAESVEGERKSKRLKTQLTAPL